MQEFLVRANGMDIPTLIFWFDTLPEAQSWLVQVETKADAFFALVEEADLYRLVEDEDGHVLPVEDRPAVWTNGVTTYAYNTLQQAIEFRRGARDGGLYARFSD